MVVKATVVQYICKWLFSWWPSLGNAAAAVVALTFVLLLMSSIYFFMSYYPSLKWEGASIPCSRPLNFAPEPHPPCRVILVSDDALSVYLVKPERLSVGIGLVATNGL